MSIQRQIILRYRRPGHVRFALPDVLCEPQAAERLVAGLKRVEGVYRVVLYRRQKKLSIRYLDGVGDFHGLAIAMKKLVTEIANTSAERPWNVENSLSKRQTVPARFALSNWARAKYRQLKETFTAAGIVNTNPVSRPQKMAVIQKQYVFEFFTDLLVLYLIKAHWHLITQHWLRRPWQYRYEWMAVLYLIFLLVRSKKPKP